MLTLILVTIPVRNDNDIESTSIQCRFDDFDVESTSIQCRFYYHFSLVYYEKII